MKPYILMGFCLLFLQLSGCSPQSEAAIDTTLPLTKLHFKRAIDVKGEIQPLTQETITTPRRLWGTIERLEPEGKLVKKGDIIAKINTREMKERISRYSERMALEAAELQRKEAQMPLDHLKIEMQQAQKKRAFEQEKLDLSLLEQGPRNDERIKARIDVEIPELQREAYPLNEKQQLHHRGYLSTQELKTAELEVESLNTNIAKSRIEEYQLSPEYREEELKEARLETDQAGLDMRISSIEGDARKSALKMKTRNSKSRIKRYQRRFDSFQERVDNAEIHAPMDGVVIYPRVWGNTQPYIGMQVWGGFPLIGVANIKQLKVAARVNEYDIPFVKTGQNVEIESASFPGQTFSGNVAKVSKLAKFKDEQNPVGLKYFDVEITMADTPPELKTHMSVQLKIMTERLPEAWTLPLDALVEDNKKTYVYFKRQGQPEKTEVEVAIKGKDFVGLKGEYSEADRVYLPTEVTP